MITRIVVQIYTTLTAYSAKRALDAVGGRGTARVRQPGAHPGRRLQRLPHQAIDAVGGYAPQRTPGTKFALSLTIATAEACTRGLPLLLFVAPGNDPVESMADPAPDPQGQQ